MEHITKTKIASIKKKLLKARSVFILLDYDGTLTPIAPKPSQAKLEPKMRAILVKLAAIPGVQLGIVTGRSLKNIQSILKIKNIIYVGNHGLELQGPGFKRMHAKAKLFFGILKQLKKKLRPLLHLYPGTLIENKNVALSFHYRMLPTDKVKLMRRALIRIIQPYLFNNQIDAFESKKAFNIRPKVQWDKGSAVQWLLLFINPDSEVLFIGDDTNDESAFKVIRQRGLGVRVGYSEKSNARYYVNNVAEVGKFLGALAR